MAATTAASTGGLDPVPARFAPPLPAILQLPASVPPLLVGHGAEAHVYKTTHFTTSLPSLAPSAAFKYRPPKTYRHPVLDARLTRHRIVSEARILARCRREGVPVPGILAVDEVAGWLMMEWIDGEVVRTAINRYLAELGGGAEAKEEGEGEEEKEEGGGGGKEEEKEKAGGLKRDQEEEAGGGGPKGDEKEAGSAASPLRDMLRRIGQVVGRLHKAGIVHGDLTTSNLMLRPGTRASRAAAATTAAAVAVQAEEMRPDRVLAGEVVVIDFGLASQSTRDEDRAVDLYVLERAFGSTHPAVEHMFAEEVLAAYAKTHKSAGAVLKKLDDVRLRGRKRSMLG